VTNERQTMKIKNLVTSDRAVSPVIGVILMVAITVILAAVIGTFVIGLGDDLGNTAPSASFDAAQDGDNVTFTHRSGDRIPNETAFITVSGDVSIDNSGTVLEDNDDLKNELDGDRAAVNKTLNAGSSVRIQLTGDEGTVSLVYDDGDRSTTLRSIDVEL